MSGEVEIWRPIAVPAFMESHEVSNCGRVRRVRASRNGHNSGLILKANRLQSGHLRFTIQERGIKQQFGAHQLVLLAFVGPCPDGLEGCHNDGDPSNNRVGNLRWDTHESNMRDRDAHGRTAGGERNGARLHPDRLARGERHGRHTKPEKTCRGERHPSAKLTAAQVEQIRTLHSAGGIDRASLSRDFGVNWSTIDRIVRGQKWASPTSIGKTVG